MRYLLDKSKFREITARQEYLYDIFHLFFLPHNEMDGFIPFVPVGTTEPSVLFLIGHQNMVDNYLKKNINEIEETSIVIITCCIESFKSFKRKNKVLYVPFSDSTYTYTYAGKDYGFGFDITRAELDFYNSSKENILLRLKDAFRAL